MRDAPVRVGPYEIVIELASGGMATTYIAHKRGDAFFERLVVVKRIHPWLLEDPKSGDMTVFKAPRGRGLVPYGISFHVGSQQHNVAAWDRALASTAAAFRTCAERGIVLTMINLGGGFPARYVRKTPKLESYGKAIFRALRRHFGNDVPETIVEPGRGLVGNAGIIEAEVVLITKRAPEDEVRWVYLDIGKFHGLAETIDESIRYPIRTARDREETAPCIIAGPTCDSVDVLYERTPYPLPVSLAIGDKVLIEATGAYTTTYSSVGFNGYPPLRQYVI